MSKTAKQERDEQVCRDILQGAPDFILAAGIDGPWVDQMTRHYGYSQRRLSYLFPSKANLVGFILSSHIAEAFEAVCVPGDWTGPPMDVLRSMSLALIGYCSDNLARHRIFLAEHERCAHVLRQTLMQQLVYLANNLQVALQAVTPGRPFEQLGPPATMLMGQLMHAALWWPRDTEHRATPTTLDAWVCTQIGLLSGLRRPDHRFASRARRRSEATLDDVPAVAASARTRRKLRKTAAAGAEPKTARSARALPPKRRRPG